MSSDAIPVPAGGPDEEEEHRAPTGTWASVPGEAEEEPRSDDKSGERLSDRPPPGLLADAERPRRREPTPTQRTLRSSREVEVVRPKGHPTPSEVAATRAPDATDPDEGPIRPRFLASELMRRRAEAQEPIWPRAARITGLIGGLAAAAVTLTWALTPGGSVALFAGALAAVLAGAAVAPLADRARGAVLGGAGGSVMVLAALLAGGADELAAGSAALLVCAGAFLRARRHRSVGARALLLVGTVLSAGAFALSGGMDAIHVDALSHGELARAAEQLALGIVMLLPLVTLVDANGPSGALVVAIAWILERFVHAGARMSLDPTAPEALGPMIAALVLPAAALGLAQAMPVAAPKKRKAKPAPAPQDG